MLKNYKLSQEIFSNDAVKGPSYQRKHDQQCKSRNALVAVDKYLRRRHAYRLLDADMVVSGVVHDKTDAGIVITLTKVHPGAHVVTQYESGGSPYLSSESRDKEETFQDVVELDMRGFCQQCEMQENKAKPKTTLMSGNPRRSEAQATDEVTDLDRHSIGDYVNALVISVDVHSEKIYLSLNNARLRGLKTTLRLGQTTRIAATSTKQQSKRKHNNDDRFASPYASPYSSPRSNTRTMNSSSYATPGGFFSFGYGSMSRSVSPYTKSAYAHPASRAPDRHNDKALCKTLRKAELFNNPEGVNIIRRSYNINQYGSLFAVHKPKACLLYQRLRQVQNQMWAKDSVYRGLAYAKQNKYDAALKCYKHALEVLPVFTQAFVARGAAYVRMGRLELAISEFEAALAIDANVPYAAKYLQAARQKLVQSSGDAQYNSDSHAAYALPTGGKIAHKRPVVEYEELPEVPERKSKKRKRKKDTKRKEKKKKKKRKKASKRKKSGKKGTKKKKRSSSMRASSSGSDSSSSDSTSQEAQLWDVRPTGRTILTYDR